MSRLRGYQQQLQAGIFEAWEAGAKVVAGVTATGSGKTVTMADTAKRCDGYGVIQAHRAELVGQLSIALAREGVRHTITASKATTRTIIDSHLEEFGHSYYDPRADWEVASVDTLIKRDSPRADKTGYVFTDEGHHVLRGNKWGRGIEKYPNARGLLMTATPTRADGKGLGSHHDGLIDAMVLGPGLGDLMGWGYLVSYDVYSAQAADLDISDVEITASGEYNQKAAAKAVKRSRKIVGDIVYQYKDKAPNKLAIVFAADIEHARTITDAFNREGIPAALVTGDDTEEFRRTTMKRFKLRELLVLVNVDLFGEGVDVPAVEAVIMARLTASFSLYSQQIGRMLRLDISPELMAAWDSYTPEQRHFFIANSPKPRGNLIDHVGNIYREFKIGDINYIGLPEGFKAWSLDRRGKRRSSAADDGIPMRMCLKTTCHKAYERIHDNCPYCGTAAPEPAARSNMQQVDGNLFKVDGALLARLRGEIARIDGAAYVPGSLDPIAARALMIRHAERQRAQYELRQAVAHWAGLYMHEPHNVIASRFFHVFGIDAATAMTLGATEAEKLRVAIVAKLGA